MDGQAEKLIYEALKEYPDNYTFSKKEVVDFCVSLLGGCGMGILKFLEKYYKESRK